jgi:tetratricopeptide (TPR) repeat protein
MRYLCVHCDHQWQPEDDTVPTRCPSCMRATGVKPVSAQTGEKKPGSRLPLIVVGLVAVLAVGAFFGLRPSTSEVPSISTMHPLDADDLAAALAAQQVHAGSLEKLLTPDSAIEAFAGKAASGANDVNARAKAVTESIRARANALAFVPWSLGEPRPTVIRTPGETLRTLQKDGARAELYPLELAALEVAALRSLDVSVMIAELIDVPGERAPLDPSGYIGYFVVALPLSTDRALLFDPYGGRNLSGNENYKVLSDATAVGAALSLRAIHELAYKADPRAALESSSQALQVAASLPAVRTARGVIVLGGKMVEQGLQEFSAASQLRADAPRLHNLASAKLMTGDVDGASKDLARALEKAPDFAAARATLAATLMLKGDAEGARAAFEKAEQLAPDLTLVQWGLAEFALRSGDRESALARAERALAKRPSFDAKVRYAVLLHQAGRYEEMRKVAHELVSLSPEYRKQDVREMLVTLLGPTALDPIEPDPTADDLADLGGPDLQLKLGDGAKLLGNPSDHASNPSVMQGAEGANEPVLMLGDRSKVRLGTGELKLRQP